MNAEPKDFTPLEKAGSQRKFSIAWLLTLAMLVMILLVAAAGGFGLWALSKAQQIEQSVQLATDQAFLLSDLQIKWLAIEGILDTLSVSRASPETKQALDQRLDELNRRIFMLNNDPPGLGEGKISENKQITRRMQQAGLQITTMVQDLYALLEEGRWGTAMDKKQAISGFQGELTQELNELNNNILLDISAQTEEMNRLQYMARNFSLIATVAGVLVAIITIWYTRRAVLKPIVRMNADIQQVSSVGSAIEIQTVEPLTQNDEIGELSRSLAEMIVWLRESYGKLEQEVQERTNRLERRTIQLEVSAQVARDIAATHDLESLLYRAVNTIHERFEFYHAGIFLIEQGQEYAVLRAATGDAGREMLAHNHKLKVGETGLVGRVAKTGEARVASDVGQDAVHFKNPLLPMTRSEAALPLIAAGKVIGVLDVQSLEAAAFDPESTSTLQIMADQLAIAIQNARLLQASQDSLSELEATYGRYNRQAWERFIHGSQVAGYEFDGMNATPLLKMDLKRGKQGESSSGEERPGYPMQIPLRVRGDTIGVLEVRKEGEEFSDAEVFLLATISNRLSQILDSARLYEEAQLHAAREQSINQLTASIARLLNTDDVLQAAARNLGTLPGVIEATVVLDADQQTLMESDRSGVKISPSSNGGNGGGDGHRP